MNLDGAVRHFQERAGWFFHYMGAYGLPVRFHEYYRSEQRQNELFKAGASKARAWESPHQYGLAVDFNFDGYGFNVPTSYWEFASRVAQAVGLETGFNWSDGNHLQLPGWRQWKYGFLKRLFA